MHFKDLTPFEKHVIEEKGTEPPFSGLYTYTDVPGGYHCKRCGTLLYRSEDKFASHCGWPSFDDEVLGAVRRETDVDGRRTEILCAACGAHLGHIFENEGFTAKNRRHCVNSVSLEFRPKLSDKMQRAVFASGCFWGTQYFLGRISGVVSTKVGYIGGHVENPTYKQVCSGSTGHVEAVEVVYDALQVDYAELVRIFFETHDFSQRDGQGPDIGPQYLSVLFYSSEAEKREAETIVAYLRKEGHEVATKLQALETFWPAEDYHQNYYERKGDSPYCHRYREIFPRSSLSKQSLRIDP